VRVIARRIVIDAIAVADVEAVVGAILPDRGLHEPGKPCGKSAIELPRVDMDRQGAKDAGAPARLVALSPVTVVSPQPVQYAGPV
jgi:hypothetical protein